MSAEAGLPGRCTVCGAVLEPEALFCGSCGARTGAAPVVPDVLDLGAAGAPVAAAAAAVTPAPVQLPWSTALGPSGAREPEPVSRPAAPAASTVAEPAPAVTRVEQGWSLGADVDVAVAPVGRRLLALLVDQVLAGVVIGAGVLVALPALRDGADPSPAALVVPGVLALLVAAGQWIAEAFAGATAGGALLGIRTVSVRTGRPPGLWAVLVRSVVQALGGLLAWIGVYLVAGSGAWDEGPMQRGWHDKAARTAVLRASYLSGRRRPADEAAAAAGLGLGRPTVASDPAARTAAGPEQAPGRGGPAGVITSVPGMPAPGGSGAPAVHAPVPVPVPERAPVAATSVDLPPGPSVPEVAAPVVEPERAVPAATSEPVAPAVLPEPESFVPLPDIPDSTIPTLSLPGDLEHTRVSGWSRPQATGTGAELRLSFDTGERLDVTGPGLVGRNPVADEGEWTHLVAIDDPDQSVSKTHLAFWPEGDRLVVTDRGSTNGTVMLDPSGVRWALMPGERVVVAAGWALVLGQRTVRVEAR